ncbi:MAG: saccharopine dehydrogenase C-terminal domain-containing protein [Bacteroidales bacterium]|nr:saccharopine dehydrogenase C-terminal domain-containing protein [Bacteroidales bacterium]
MHKILVLGAGMVAKPLIDYLLKHNYKVTIACNTCDKARKILKDHPNGEIIYWDANETEVLKPLVKEAELVVSLLPYKFHAGVAEVCIQYGKNMVTTSYVRHEMSGLDKKAREAGIIILNEIGLDPGIDHMSAMKIIDNIKSKGGTIEKFWSVCGALPAPENIDNPMGYKFSWSPEGVLLAGLNDARYLDEGRVVTIRPEELFKKTFDYKVRDVGTLEVYPNRDSINYIDIYGLQGIKTIFRGTFRYKGWCETIDAMKSVNLLNRAQEDFSGKTYADMIRDRTGGGRDNIKEQLAEHLNLNLDSAAIKSFEWLGLLSDKKIPSFMKTAF